MSEIILGSACGAWPWHWSAACCRGQGPGPWATRPLGPPPGAVGAGSVRCLQRCLRAAPALGRSRVCVFCFLIYYVFMFNTITNIISK